MRHACIFNFTDSRTEFANEVDVGMLGVCICTHLRDFDPRPGQGRASELRRSCVLHSLGLLRSLVQAFGHACNRFETLGEVECRTMLWLEQTVKTASQRVEALIRTNTLGVLLGWDVLALWQTPPH